MIIDCRFHRSATIHVGRWVHCLWMCLWFYELQHVRCPDLPPGCTPGNAKRISINQPPRPPRTVLQQSTIEVPDLRYLANAIRFQSLPRAGAATWAATLTPQSSWSEYCTAHACWETPPSNRVFFGTGPSNHVFVKKQVGSTVFLFVYMALVSTR